MNFGAIGVELRMKERRIEEGIQVNPLVRYLVQGHLFVVADCLLSLLSINYSFQNFNF